MQEVSAVNYPAYEGTSINARNGELADADKAALDNARAKAELDRRQTEPDGNVELEKLKAKYLYHI